MRYDLVILGNAFCGLQSAVVAARCRQRVAVIGSRDRSPRDRISRDSLREAAVTLTGYRHRAISSELLERRRQVTLKQARTLGDQIANSEWERLMSEALQLGVEFISGSARFAGPHEVQVESSAVESQRLLSENIFIATETSSLRPNWIPFDGTSVIDGDEALALNERPDSMVVIANGIDGIELAMIFALLGTEVTLLLEPSNRLAFADEELLALLWHHAGELGLRIIENDTVEMVERFAGSRVSVRAASGAAWEADGVLYAGGRRGDCDSLRLESAGLQTDEHGLLWCNEFGQTWRRNIYGLGELVGYPHETQPAIDQPVRVVQHALRAETSVRVPTACCLETLPQLAAVGATEETLLHEGVPYLIGTAHFQDSSRGAVGGEPNSVLKLLFHRDSRQLLGAHCLADSARTLIQIGQTVISLNGTIDDLQDPLFGAGALTECYRLAAADARTQLRRLSVDSTGRRAAAARERATQTWCRLADTVRAEFDYAGL